MTNVMEAESKSFFSKNLKSVHLCKPFFMGKLLKVFPGKSEKKKLQNGFIYSEVFFIELLK